MMKFSLNMILLILMLAVPWNSFGQLRSVSGVVKDSQGIPLPGVSIIIKGTTKGTTSDVDGKYSLQIDNEEVTLVFSFVGFESQEIKAGNLSAIDISLKEDVTSLQEVIVIGYGEVKKSDLTGSVVKIKAGDLNKVPAASVDQLLQGRAAGLQVINSSGEPGASMTIRIRGLSSFSGSNSPLVVVDGFPWGDAGNLKQINPDDIESIEVLKDASASAIYGSRGANGVIMITTKKGKAGEAKITFSTLLTSSSLPDKLDVWKDPVDVAIIDNEARVNAGLSPLFVGADYLGTYYPSIAELRGEDPAKAPWPHKVYWPDLVYRNPFSQTYTLTANGGTEKTKYSISGNLYDEQGLAIANEYRRYNTRVNLDQKIHEKITLGANLIITHIDREGGNSTGDLGVSAGRSPVFPVYNEDGTYFKISPLDYNHPLARAYDVLNESKTIDVLGSLSLNYNITDWLTFRSTISNKYGNAINDNYQPRHATYTGFQFQGFGFIDNWSGNELLNENYFTFNKELNNIHKLTFVAGYSTQVSSSRGSKLEGHGFVNDNLRNENMNAAREQISSNWLSKSLLTSWIGRASYSLQDKYLLTLTARADGSTKFGANNKVAFFPSAAFAWKMHEETFLKSISAVSEAKLRVSYGISGNQGIPPYRTLDRLGSGRYYTDGAFQQGFGPGVFEWDGYNKIWQGVPNQSLRWETTAQFNVGLDMGLFQNRVTFTADYYVKQTRDLLRTAFMSPSSGYDQIWINDGDVDNKGIELGLNGDVISSGDLTWTLGGNFTLNRNEVTNTGADEFVWHGSTIEMLRTPINTLIVGEPYDVFYGYKTDGIIQTEEEGQASGLIGAMANPGEIKYLDISGPEGAPDGVVDQFDRTVIGNPNPDFIYSVNTNVKFKGFDLSAQLYGVQGNDVFDFTKFSPSRQLQRWTPDNPTDEFPSVNSTRAYWGSDWFVTDGSFLRIQNVTVGYNVNADFLKVVKNARIFISGNNLYTLTKFHTGFDPEVQVNGQHWGSYPRPRSISLGVNIGF
jgi:TonB-dependent starch-binding outer membrane protein SusC